MKFIPTFPSWNCFGQRVFLRADLNVPIQDGTILNDRRLQAIQPSLDHLIKQGASVILATHLGRPSHPDPALSTQHLVSWFKEHGYTITFCSDLNEACTQSKRAKPKTIILLENMRFYEGEKKQDTAFAQQLASLADWYVNDACGTLHRTDTSITLLAEQFDSLRRSIGFLIEKELNILDRLRHNPSHPVCIILGGAKVADKLPLIEHLIEITDHLILCPALVLTFLQATGNKVGKSLVDTSVSAYACAILKKASKKHVAIHLPIDYQVARNTLLGPLSVVPATEFPQDSIGISIGPHSIGAFRSIIQRSETIFFNGAIGFSDRPETLEGMRALLSAMAESTATTIVAGGDSLSILDHFSITGITHCLTGGGSSLAYLSDKILPGLSYFLNLKDGTKSNKR